MCLYLNINLFFKVTQNTRGFMAKHCTVLITEDDHEDASFLQQALRENSFKGNIEHVENGVQLLSKLIEMKSLNLLPEMIVLDLNMPLKGGLEVLNEMSTDDTLKRIPVAVVTASLRNEDELTCSRLGCDLYFRKPIKMKEYTDLASRLVGHIRSKHPYC